jgi:glutamyl-tRNA synthetase
VFNAEKLDWFNQQYIMRLAPDELARRLKPWFEAEGIWDDAYLTDRHAWFFAVLELLKPRAKRLDEFAMLGRFFFADTVEYDETAITKHVRIDGMRGHLEALDRSFHELETFDPASTENALRSVAERRGVKAAALIQATRVALTGKTVSPGLFDVAALLGRTRTHERLTTALRKSV